MTARASVSTQSIWWPRRASLPGRLMGRVAGVVAVLSLVGAILPGTVVGAAPQGTASASGAEIAPTPIATPTPELQASASPTGSAAPPGASDVTPATSTVMARIAESISDPPVVPAHPGAAKTSLPAQLKQPLPVRSSVKFWPQASPSTSAGASPAAASGPFVTALAPTNDHTCALISDGTVECWGRNDTGQLGNQVPGDRSTPAKVVGVAGAVAIASGADYGIVPPTGYSCAIVTDGAVQCWGYGTFGALGNGTGSSGGPVYVSGITGAVAIVAAGGHACVILQEGSVACWGRNDQGQVGDGTARAYSPVIAQGVSGATVIAAGVAHTCVIVTGGAISCWGANWSGALGNGTWSGGPTPVPVTGISKATSLTAGDGYTCALTAGGIVKCWGNHGACELRAEAFDSGGRFWGHLSRRR